jgi:high affinity Mn2+ porin
MQVAQVIAIGVLLTAVVRPVLGDEIANTAANKAPGAASDWSGLYVGGSVGQNFGNTDARLQSPSGLETGATFASLVGGVHGGYNYALPGRIIAGVELDFSFPNYFGADDLVWSALTPQGHFGERMDYLASLRGRLGYAFGPWLLYGTGGFAWAGVHVFHTPQNSDDEEVGRAQLHTGWTAGVGVEHAIDRYWKARLEYLHTDLAAVKVALAPDTHYRSTFDTDAIRLGLSRKIDTTAGETTGSRDDTSGGPSRWEIHGQTTFIEQGYPAFPALYSGAHSLSPGSQGKETWTTSAFLGVRLWQGGEFYYNPELLQGFGLNDTTGAAGYPNGEAQKSSFLYPHYNTSRFYLRQTFGLGGEQETIESAYGQMSDKKDLSRVTVQVGKFSVHDLFDNNAYAQDSRTDFLNWSIWAAGAFDYPADRLGFTWGGAIELNQKDWAARAGYFLVGDEPNSNTFDLALFRRGGYISELELRYQVSSQPGKLRITAWLTNTFSGSYQEAVELTLANPGLDATTAIEQTRTDRIKYGYIVNLEQAVSKDIGVFSRWSWNSGTNEISAFTDIDASLAIGASIKGTKWGRPEDRWGIAAAVNALSKDHRDYLAVGGLGILIGDGTINYQPEHVFETYYALNLGKNATLTFDYQYLTNPADNADRGPVHIFAGRLHSEF